jgi:hypothetical protein
MLLDRNADAAREAFDIGHNRSRTVAINH